MKIYSLKSIAQRGTTLGMAFAIAASSFTPFAPAAFADALNPLTDRSLTLSSSSPGWANTDGSGNSTYAPPNSGANGQKTGNYFSFNVSSTATVKTMSFQYCTNPAGDCEIPGNNVSPGVDTATTSDLNVNYPSAAEVGGSDFATVIDSSDGSVIAVPGYTNNNPKYSGSGDPAEAAKDVDGNFVVMRNVAGTWTQATGWTAEAHNVTTGSNSVSNNYITLTNTTGVALTAGQEVKVLFFATADDYITNPGQGAFFVKINTYSKEFDAGIVDPEDDTLTETGLHGLQPVSDENVIDGGVTVANVMNQSIQITTKVLETMQFSVGTVDPNTLSSVDTDGVTPGVQSPLKSATGDDSHKPCGTIATRMTSSDPQNVLELGDQAAESSLKTDQTYATHSYWRLSSNSSAGATVYYSGHTLSNTVGDEIDAIGTSASTSAQGSEQFGLALSTAALGNVEDHDQGAYGVNYATAGANENAADNGVTGVDSSVLLDLGATNAGSWDYTALNKSYHSPRLDPLVPTAAYAGGAGTITNGGTAAFAFDEMSDTVPVAIASQNTEVVDCVTAKMRYIANIAATTPAGIYTTKVNYIAAPQY